MPASFYRRMGDYINILQGICLVGASFLDDASSAQIHAAAFGKRGKLSHITFNSSKHALEFALECGGRSSLESVRFYYFSTLGLEEQIK